MIKKFWEFINEGRKVSKSTKKISLNDCGALCIKFKKKYNIHDKEYFSFPWNVMGYNLLYKHDRLFQSVGSSSCDKIIITPIENDQVETALKEISNRFAIDSYIFIPSADGNALMKYINDESKPEWGKIKM